jgi:hypothetical protein
VLLCSVVDFVFAFPCSPADRIFIVITVNASLMFSNACDKDYVQFAAVVLKIFNI